MYAGDQWAKGHHSDNIDREDGYGSVTTVLHPPVKGTYSTRPPPPPPPLPRSYHRGPSVDNSGSRSRGSESSTFSSGKLPKLNFPYFEGENCRLWISRVELYFEMYHVDSSMWVSLEAYHCTDAAARWIQSIEKKVETHGVAGFLSRRA